MPWYRMVFTQEDLRAGRLERCERELQLMLGFITSPQASAYLHRVLDDVDEDAAVIVYVSPELAALVSNLLTWLSGEVCAAPDTGRMQRLYALTGDSLQAQWPFSFKNW